MIPDDAHQLPLVGADLGPRAGRADLSRVLLELDSYGYNEVDARAQVDLVRQGGTFARPIAYLCSDEQIYWTKKRSQTGLCSELIANRLAYHLGVGPKTSIVRIDSFLMQRGSDSARAVGTINLTSVAASKEIEAAVGSGTLDPASVDPHSRAGAAVFQSWIDIIDEQVLIGIDGRVFSYDHGDAFRWMLPGPPRMVVASIPGTRLDWSASAASAIAMVDKIEAMTPVEVLEAVARIPDEPAWQGMFHRRLEIARWLIKRRELLREEVMKWTRAMA